MACESSWFSRDSEFWPLRPGKRVYHTYIVLVTCIWFTERTAYQDFLTDVAGRYMLVLFGRFNLEYADSWFLKQCEFLYWVLFLVAVVDLIFFFSICTGNSLPLWWFCSAFWCSVRKEMDDVLSDDEKMSTCTGTFFMRCQRGKLITKKRSSWSIASDDCKRIGHYVWYKKKGYLSKCHILDSVW